MRKTTLFSTCLFALLLAFASLMPATAGTATETATESEILSIFAADAAQLELMLIFSGDSSTVEANAGSTCYDACRQVMLSCLASCGPGFYCDQYCNDQFNLCLMNNC